MTGSVLIVGSGPGLSASLARLFAREGYKVFLAARDIEKLQDLAMETKSSLIKCDASDPSQVSKMYEELDLALEPLEIVIYNPSARVRGPIQDLDPVETSKALDITCYGAFLVAQQAASRMLVNGRGSIFFTGASAGVKGFANSTVFAMGKFGLRGLAQALARELHPKNIHIGHFVIDGGIGKKSMGNYQMINPDEIAKTYLDFYNQDKSVWSWEIELRTSVEKF